MNKQTGNNYQSSKMEKALFAGEAKMGKSSFLVASALGMFPGQTEGGIVTSPKHLHVITADSNALGGIKRFLLESCGAPAEALEFNVLNMQDDFRQASTSKTEYDSTFFNSVMQAVVEVESLVAARPGVHAVIVSSLTSMALGLERSIAGPPQKKGNGMDQSKWGAFSHQVNEMRSRLQRDMWHCLWEAHLYRPQDSGQDKDAPAKTETLQVSGKSGQNFGNNVEHIYRVRRQFNNKLPGTKIDKVFLDPHASFDFVAGGRNTTEALAPQEPDLTAVFTKLGLAVGGWRPSSTRGTQPPPKVAVKQNVRPM